VDISDLLAQLAQSHEQVCQLVHMLRQHQSDSPHEIHQDLLQMWAASHDAHQHIVAMASSKLQSSQKTEPVSVDQQACPAGATGLAANWICLANRHVRPLLAAYGVSIFWLSICSAVLASGFIGPASVGFIVIATVFHVLQSRKKKLAIPICSIGYLGVEGIAVASAMGRPREAFAEQLTDASSASMLVLVPWVWFIFGLIVRCMLPWRKRHVEWYGMAAVGMHTLRCNILSVRTGSAIWITGVWPFTSIPFIAGMAAGLVVQAYRPRLVHPHC